MANASINFTQGSSTGGPGNALMGTTGTVVVVTNGDDTDVVNWEFAVLDVGTGSAVSQGVVQDGATPSWSFTPDVRGGYLIQLTTEDRAGNLYVDQRVFGVLEENGLFIPPFQANSASLNFITDSVPNEKGWAPFLNAWLQLVEEGGGGGGLVTVSLGVVGDVVLDVSAPYPDAVFLNNLGWSTPFTFQMLNFEATSFRVMVYNYTDAPCTVLSGVGGGLTLGVIQAFNGALVCYVNDDSGEPYQYMLSPATLAQLTYTNAATNPSLNLEALINFQGDVEVVTAVDTTSSPFTLTLDASVQRLTIFDYDASFGTNNVTINGASFGIVDWNGNVTDTIILDQSWTRISMTFDPEVQIWRVQSYDTPDWRFENVDCSGGGDIVYSFADQGLDQIIANGAPQGTTLVLNAPIGALGFSFLLTNTGSNDLTVQQNAGTSFVLVPAGTSYQVFYDPETELFGGSLPVANPIAQVSSSLMLIGGQLGALSTVRQQTILTTVQTSNATPLQGAIFPTPGSGDGPVPNTPPGAMMSIRARVHMQSTTTLDAAYFELLWAFTSISYTGTGPLGVSPIVVQAIGTNAGAPPSGWNATIVFEGPFTVFVEITGDSSLTVNTVIMTDWLNSQ